jgi:phosphatidylglycerophosphate synthase
MRALSWPVWMLAAVGASVYLGAAEVFSAAGLAAFVLWAVFAGRAWAVGPANWLTLARVALTAGLAPAMEYLDRPALVAMIGACFALDSLDGWLARKTGTASALGADYDMESDAFLVMVLCMLLYTGGTLGAWALTAGLWRYGYAVIIVIAPSAGEAPRSSPARYIYGVLAGSLIAAFAVPALAVPAVALGTAAVSYSFGRSLWWSFRPWH